METAFIDGQEKVVERDFVTVRNSGGRLVFMGERQNIKCFDRLKKISERLYETLSGQTYKFLDKIPEPEKPKELEIPEHIKRQAEQSWQLHCMTRDAGTRAAASTLEPQPMSFDAQLEHNWRFNLGGIRKEFVSLASYAAYCKAVRDGRCRA